VENEKTRQLTEWQRSLEIFSQPTEHLHVVDSKAEALISGTFRTKELPDIVVYRMSDQRT
jgi:hypothetical protein